MILTDLFSFMVSQIWQTSDIFLDFKPKCYFWKAKIQKRLSQKDNLGSQ